MALPQPTCLQYTVLGLCFSLSDCYKCCIFNASLRNAAIRSLSVRSSVNSMEMSIPANEKWQCCATGKVTVGLASHWPCVTVYGLSGVKKRDENGHAAYTLYRF